MSSHLPLCNCPAGTYFSIFHYQYSGNGFQLIRSHYGKHLSDITSWAHSTDLLLLFFGASKCIRDGGLDFIFPSLCLSRVHRAWYGNFRIWRTYLTYVHSPQCMRDEAIVKPIQAHEAKSVIFLLVLKDIEATCMKTEEIKKTNLTDLLFLLSFLELKKKDLLRKSTEYERVLNLSRPR